MQTPVVHRRVVSQQAKGRAGQGQSEVAACVCRQFFWKLVFLYNVEVMHVQSVSESPHALNSRKSKAKLKGVIMSVYAETVTLCHMRERIQKCLSRDLGSAQKWCVNGTKRVV